MASYNRVVLLGNLTRDPQLKYLPSQTPVVEFGMAMNRKYKTQSGESKEEVTFVDCSAFGRTAEIINQYCRKGNMLFVEGRLKYDTWEDKQGGGKRSKVTVHIDNVQLMPRSDGRGGGGGGGPAMEDSGSEEDHAPAPARPQSRPTPARAQSPIGEEQQFKEDDIPF
jgi:single-strand DNA-binding protein